jgi:hypothetical protein
MNTLEALHEEMYLCGIHIERTNLPRHIKGFYYKDDYTSPVVTLDYSVTTYKEEKCILAEELGHHYTSTGDILIDKTVDKVIISKQEYIACKWAVDKLITLDELVTAFKSGANNKFEVAEHLDITEDFLNRVINIYSRKYGPCVQVNSWLIYFDPFGYMRDI